MGEKQQQPTGPEPLQHNKAEPVVEGKHSLAYGTRTLDPAIRLVDRAREIELADQSISSHTNAKLELILKQIRNLQDEARMVVERAEIDTILHRVKCSFEKAVGQQIYLYEKNGEQYFSLLSPADWDGNPPHPFRGSYTLNADRSFSRIETDEF